MRNLQLTTLVALVGASARAQAGIAVWEWQTVAAGCVPGDPAIQGNLYLDTAGSVKHQDSTASQITLYCPVDAEMIGNAPTSLHVTYVDNDTLASRGATTNVLVSLIKMDAANGGLTTLATFDSNSFGSTGDTPVDHSITFSGAPNDNGNWFLYLRVDMTRRNTAALCSAGATGPCRAIFFAAELTLDD